MIEISYLCFQVARTQKLKKEKNEKRRKSQMCLKEKMTIEAPQNNFLIHEIVLATIPGFSPWPARIVNIMDETIHVEFFGTGQVLVDNFFTLIPL